MPQVQVKTAEAGGCFSKAPVGEDYGISLLFHKGKVTKRRSCIGACWPALGNQPTVWEKKRINPPDSGGQAGLQRAATAGALALLAQSHPSAPAAVPTCEGGVADVAQAQLSFFSFSQESTSEDKHRWAAVSKILLGSHL